MFKFIHAADIHLDSPLRGLSQYPGAPVDRIRQASRQALRNLVDVAIAEKVAFVLIAGDLYDRDRDDYNVILFFNQQMRRLDDEGIRVFVIRGNHDAANRMTTRLNPPPNVTMFPDDQALSVGLDDLRVMIHGQGFATERIESDLSRHYPEALDGYFNIGLLHTCAGGVEGHERYAPCNYDVLKSKRYDYWALGHVHQRGPGFANGDETIQFSGNIQGRHIRETGAKGCLLATVDDRRDFNIEFRALDVLRWERCVVDASEAETPDDLLNQFSCELREIEARSDARPLAVRVEFVGECAAHADLAANPQRWMNEVRSRAAQETNEYAWVEKVILSTSSTDGTEDFQGLDGPIGELAALVLELRSNPEQLQEFRHELDDLTTRLAGDLRPDERVGLMPEGPEDLAVLAGEVQGFLTSRLLDRGGLS